MGDETRKKERTTAKRLFTRALNSLKKSIDENCDLEIITNRFQAVKGRWDIVQESHESYIETVDVALINEEDSWIQDLQDVFEKLEVDHLDAIRKNIQQENLHKARATEIENERKMKEKLNEIICRSEKLLQRRTIEEITFNGLIDKILSMMVNQLSDKNSFAAINIMYQEIKEQFEKCKLSNSDYIESLDKPSQEDLWWILSVQEKYLTVMQKYSNCVKQNEELCVQNKKSTNISKMRLEPMKFPHFKGDIRSYPRFKSDFLKYILPEINSSDSVAFVLKSCLEGEAFDVITNVDDDVKEMWSRLDEKYGQPSKLVDLIMGDIKKMKVIPDGEVRKFIELVNTVERGYRDLKRVKFEREISNATVISMIEAVLPKSVRHEWAREVKRRDSVVNEDNKFNSLLEFMLEQKRILEYQTDDLRSPYSRDIDRIDPTLCWIHKNASHHLENCTIYTNKSAEDRVAHLKENGACFRCLSLGHTSSQCKVKVKCSNTDCGKLHHHTLHEAHVAGSIYHSILSESACVSKPCLLQLMMIGTNKREVNANVLWDGGATDSLITFEKAKKLKLFGQKVNMTIAKVGGDLEDIESFLYKLPLRNSLGAIVMFNVYGIKKISSPIQPLDVSKVTPLFHDLSQDEVRRPQGEVDVLIGLDYAAFHPQICANVNHLVLVENQFGKCLSGKHALLTENTRKVVSFSRINLLITNPSIGEFFSIESLGTNSDPKCGACRCGSCPIGGKDYNLRDERELMLIDKGLEYTGDHWVASYPWVRDAADLPDNRSVALAILKSTEKRLLKDFVVAKQYKEQMDEMVERGVARKLSQKELYSYKGPCHYISHHEVMKKDSVSTPCRIVFNASANYKGHVLNEYWAKGPDFVNNLLGIMLRFRENHVAIVGDIKRMYHTIKLSEFDQHTHRFVWRNLEINKPPDTFVITSVCFGDRPAAAISSLALRKTATMNKNKYPVAEWTILNNTYVDDIIESAPDYTAAVALTKDIEASIGTGAFIIKSWTFSGDNLISDNFLNNNYVDSDNKSQKVLGIRWDPAKDIFFFKVRINFSCKKRKIRVGEDLNKCDIDNSIPTELTKRMILSQINGVFDPLGLVTPFIVRSKILMRKLWVGTNKGLGWDDPITLENRNEWKDFFVDLFDVEKLAFNRCIKPKNATIDENPTLVIFSDASEKAFGCCAYIRWKLNDNSYKSYLLCAKSRVAPVSIVSIVRLELNGALLAKRIKVFIETEMRIVFKNVYFLIDSKVVLAMLHKESYGFHTYAAVRIGEIQQSTNISDWYWLESVLNISDWTSRGKKPADLSEGDHWQNGPGFLKLEEHCWPVKQNYEVSEIPELIQVNLQNVIAVSEKLSDRININRFSSYLMLIFTTARVLSFYQCKPRLSFRNALITPTSLELEKATEFWIRDAQSVFNEEVMKEQFTRLSPRCREDGIFIVGTRIEKWLNDTYNREGIVLLPRDHRISFLYSTFIHNICHSGISTTVSKIRHRFWIVRLTNLVKSIVNKCVQCKVKRKLHVEQLMCPLPIDRLKPAPAWYSIAIDYFGPLEIRGEVNKRSRSTCYGVIFNSLEMRGVHLDIVSSCSTDSFLMALRRFGTIRGWPSKILSDNGSQLRNASKRLKDIVKDIDWNEVEKFGAEKGIEWKFTPADSPWHNGCSESLIKSTKLAMKSAINNQILAFAELQTVVYEVANILNERPIGKHPIDPDEGSYLCPNDLLLGRATSRIPGGPFITPTSPKQRYEFIESITNSFWRKMTRDYFPSLIIRPKWHVEKRNIAPGDIVIIQDSNALRGEWKLGRVKKVRPSDDGLVRKCQVQYKIKQQNGEIATRFTYVERSVQRLVVILPVEDQ